MFNLLHYFLTYLLLVVFPCVATTTYKLVQNSDAILLQADAIMILYLTNNSHIF
jgi:hypothetical protein